jgi:hypothetical protein
MGFLVEDLLISIKSRTLAPISQSTFADADLITIADEELRDSIVPTIMEAREDFFRASLDRILVSGIDKYLIPERAIGNALKGVSYVDANGREYPRLPREKSSNADIYSGSTAAQPVMFDIEGDRVIVLPKPLNPSGLLRLRYYMRPNQLIATAQAAKILSTSSLAGLTTFTVDTDQSAVLLPGAKIDFVRSTSPFLLWAFDVVIQSITATTIVVNTSDVQDVNGLIYPQATDYICPAKQSNIPMIPMEYHSVLAQKCAERILESLGHSEKLQAAMAKGKEKEMAASKVISNRVEDSPKTIVNRNGFMSTLRRW